jgi:Tfp pilus assembly protein PilF
VNDAALYYNRGFSCLHNGDYDRAIADLNIVARMDQRSAIAYHQRGLAYFWKDDCDRAVKDFKQAIKIDPAFIGAYQHLGFAYPKKSEQYKALAAAAWAEAFSPSENKEGGPK